MGKIKRRFETIFHTFYKSTLFAYAYYSALMVLILEILNQKSFISGIEYVYKEPLSFLCAFLLIFTTFSVSLVIPKRTAYMILASGVWLGLGIANFVLLQFRVNPLSAVDFKILASVINIINVYLKTYQIILICLSILAALCLCAYVAIKTSTVKPNYKRAVPAVLVIATVTFTAFFLSVKFAKPDIKEANIADAYDNYGFVYCFALSASTKGIDKPETYTHTSISAMMRRASAENDNRLIDDYPNIIMIQLESFFDVKGVEGLELTSDPVPVFRNLKERFPSGSLEVPTSGAGTVNTEFEVLCGMRTKYFGMGEYPYETTLMKSPCESLAYYLKNQKYTCHSIHNNTGTFYNRDVVMENLGFDTFTPIEYMSGVEKNALGWAKDEILKDEITGALDSTKGRDFIYAISVQPHGKYVDKPGDWGDISVSGDYDEKTLYGLEYYVNQLYETDGFVGDLIEALEEFDEKTVVVLFGDHLPSFDFDEESLEHKSIYKTEYVIWSNYELEARDEDMTSYRLGAYLLDLLGLKGGIISDAHNNLCEDADYENILRNLQYDLIFGEKYAYKGKFPYEVPDMKYGWGEIKITDAYVKDETLYVSGEKFTESSVIFIDGLKKETKYISENLLSTPFTSSFSMISAAQVAENGKLFSIVTYDYPYKDLFERKRGS